MYEYNSSSFSTLDTHVPLMYVHIGVSIKVINLIKLSVLHLGGGNLMKAL